MSILIMLLIVFVAGAVGGFVNALMSDNGLSLPKTIKAGDFEMWHPGFVGNIVVGGFAAMLSWGLYGAAVAWVVLPFGSVPKDQTLTVGALMSAALVGTSGARWLTNEIDKRILQAAASEAKASDKNEDAARKMMNVSPTKALKIAME